jgi:hypothetical protein
VSQAYNFYCDESCHLENDNQTAMVLGGVWCPAEKTHRAARRIRDIKARHRLKLGFEAKWVKVSQAKVEFYQDIIDYFFDDDDLHFRALVVPNKKELNHSAFNQTHDDWYYKMYFEMLKAVFRPGSKYYIYLDYKDTHGSQKAAKLHGVLCNNTYDFSRQIIRPKAIGKTTVVWATADSFGTRHSQILDIRSARPITRADICLA